MPEAMAHGIHPKHSVPRTEVDICMFTLLCRIVINMVYSKQVQNYAIFLYSYSEIQILPIRHLILQEHNIVDREIKDISFRFYFPFV